MEYFKSVRANRYTALGYALIPFTIIFYNSDFKFIQILWLCITYISVITLSFTAFGLQTLRTYRRTKKSLTMYNKAPNVYREYCDIVGYQLAVKESKQNNQLNN